MTYNKPTKTVQIGTLMGNTISGDAESIRAFNNKDTVKGKSSGNDVYVPFHAVASLIEMVTTTSATRADAYCADGE